MSLLERFKLEEREQEALNTKPKKTIVIQQDKEIEFEEVKSNTTDFED